MINNIEESKEKQDDSNINRLLYLKQQKDILERAREAIKKLEQIVQVQKEVTILSHEKWSEIDNSVKSVQEDIDFYVREYIMPIQERQQELDKLENSLISIPENKSVVGRVGKFFERFIPGITKEGRQRRKIENTKQILEEELETYKLMKEKNPFELFGTNKDIKGQLIEKIDVTQLDKYSTTKNEPKNYLKPDNSVQSIANSIKRDDITNILATCPELKEEASYLTSELINNGMEAFNRMVDKIVKDNTQKKNELIPQMDVEEQQEYSSEDILDRITKQIQSIMDNLTPEELEEIKKREQNKQIRI